MNLVQNGKASKMYKTETLCIRKKQSCRRRPDQRRLDRIPCPVNLDLPFSQILQIWGCVETRNVNHQHDYAAFL